MRRGAFILYFLLIGSLYSQANDLTHIRTLLERANNDERYFDDFSKALRQNSFENSSLKNGYIAMELFMKSKLAGNPYYKIKYFNEAKEALETAILNDRSNLELRYLRYCVQFKAPFYLNYYSHMDEDKKILIKNVRNVQDLDLKVRIRKFLLTNAICSEKEIN